MGGDTKDPDQLIERVKAEINAVKGSGIREEDFERSRRKKVGGFLRQLNSPEAIANEFTKYRFKDIDLFDIAPVYEELTLADVNEQS